MPETPANPVVIPPVNPSTPASPGYFVNPDGTYIDKFWEHPSFPAELKDNEQLRTHKNFSDTLANWGSLHRLNGYDKIPLPAPNSNDDVWDTVYDRLGRPKAVTDYKLPEVDASVPADRRAKPEFIQGVLTLLHKAGLSQRQLDIILPGWNGLVESQSQATLADQQRAADQAMQGLKSIWGVAYDPNKSLVERYIKSVVKPERQASVLKLVTSDPGLLQEFHSRAVAAQEAEPDTSANMPQDVRAAATAELDKLRTDPAYTDPYHRDHERVVRLANEIRARLGPAK
jgi:hypothetical protein